MSLAIMNALNKLNESIGQAEIAAANAAKRPKPAAPAKPAAGQTDLFGSANNVVGFDRAALTKKLDMTIAKVEQLLGEV